jgi:hypothetical protein
MTIEEYLDLWKKRRWVSAYDLATAMEVSPRTVRNWLYSRRTPLVPWMAHDDVRFIKFTAQSVISFVEGGFFTP